MLVWSALGGGSISLPYLEQEAFGEIDPRFRFYGFINDSEFIAECQKHGIKVFGIVFEVQGWEFPVELNEAEDRVLAINELRGAGQARLAGPARVHPEPLPEAVAAVRALLSRMGWSTATASRSPTCSRSAARATSTAVPCHARWVECPDREHYCYTDGPQQPGLARVPQGGHPHPDRRRGGWRAAGRGRAAADQPPVRRLLLQGLHEGIPRISAGAARRAAAGRAARAWIWRPSTTANGCWRAGYDFKTNREDDAALLGLPALPARGRSRATSASWPTTPASMPRSQGREVLVSGNFFNLFDQYYPLEPKVDLIITEMRNTRYRQPAWYRYVAGFAGPKPVVVVENPYGGVVPELVGKLKSRQGLRPVPHVDLRGGRAGREHEPALRRLDGQRDRGCLLRRRTSCASRSRTSSPSTRRCSARARSTTSPWSTASRATSSW